MKKIYIVIIVVALIGTGIGGYFMLPHLFGDEHESGESISERIKLPEPKYSSSVSIEQALLERRSVRAYPDEPLTLTEVAQLLWSAQGINRYENVSKTGISKNSEAGRYIQWNWENISTSRYI